MVLEEGGLGFYQPVITNVRNARSNSRSFFRRVLPGHGPRYVSSSSPFHAPDILYEEGIRYLINIGGEPMFPPFLARTINRAEDWR